MDRNLFVSDLDGKRSTQLTQGRGWHRVELSKDFTQFYDYHSDINTPQTVTQYTINNKNGVTAVKGKVVIENNKLKNTLANYELSKAEFIRVPNSKGDTLNGWMLKPTNFDPARKISCAVL
jgi:dipeptidyl-peptidase-4